MVRSRRCTQYLFDGRAQILIELSILFIYAQSIEISLRFRSLIVFKVYSDVLPRFLGHHSWGIGETRSTHFLIGCLYNCSIHVFVSNISNNFKQLMLKRQCFPVFLLSNLSRLRLTSTSNTIINVSIIIVK